MLPMWKIQYKDTPNASSCALKMGQNEGKILHEEISTASLAGT